MNRRTTPPPQTAGGFVRGIPQGRNLARRSAIWGAVLVVVIFTVLAQLGENGIVSWWRLHGQQADLRREVEELDTANTELETRIAALAEDPEALEQLAREDHGMRRPDEEVLTVLREEDPDTGNPSSP